MVADREKQAALEARLKLLAHRCVRLALALADNRLGRHVCGQLIRCSTSVACNYRAACLGESRRAFAAKLSDVLEEADETDFWLEFVAQEALVEPGRIESLRAEAREVRALFLASRRTCHRYPGGRPAPNQEVRDQDPGWVPAREDEF